MSIDPKDAKSVASLITKRRYYRECKIPALERMFDAVKAMIGPQAGMLGPFECPPDTDEWLAYEYRSLSLELGNLGLEVGDIEYRVKRITGFSVEELDEHIQAE